MTLSRLTFSTSPFTWGLDHMATRSHGHCQCHGAETTETCCGGQPLCTVYVNRTFLYFCLIYPGVPLFTFVQGSSVPRSCLWSVPHPNAPNPDPNQSLMPFVCPILYKILVVLPRSCSSLSSPTQQRPPKPFPHHAALILSHQTPSHTNSLNHSLVYFCLILESLLVNQSHSNATTQTTLTNVFLTSHNTCGSLDQPLWLFFCWRSLTLAKPRFKHD